MNRALKSVLGVLVTSTLLAVVACGSSDDGTGGTDDNLNSSGGSSSGASGSSSGDFGTSSGGTSSGQPKECAAQEAAASLAKKPVDIVFTIDNSGSMSTEIIEVQNQINTNFAAVIGASGIDYRIIMVTRHGSATSGQSVCISKPLSSVDCAPSLPAQPGETTKFFHHSVEIASTDAWCRILTSFNTADEFNKHPTGWGSLLRDGAFKVFVTITDDRISTSCNVGGTNKSFSDTSNPQQAAADFDAALLALSPKHFGTAAKRNYLFHTIAGLNYFDTADKTKATPPTAPLTTTTCGSDAVNVGPGHQAISMLTGGLRYPSCAPGAGLKQDYSPIFKEMAKGVIEGAKLVCEFPVPPAPAGETLDLTTVVPRYTPGTGGAPVDFGQVGNAAACAPNKFYIENNVIKLCPATCDVVQADTKASIKVLFGCAPKGAN